MPQFTATFVPSGHDDYSMPEMYAPSPQRVMPEVPQNMQQDIQRMEFEAGHRQQYGAAPNYRGEFGHGRDESLTSVVSGYTDGSSNYRPFEDDQKNYHPMASLEMPGKNPFPRLKGDNIPPSDDEKEEILYNAREHVLHSNNVNMQLSWARDALNFVETASEVRAREDASRNGGRSQTPAVEHELRVDAMNIIMYLSEQRHPEAVFMRAKWDEFGKFGTREDKRAAFKGYRTAAEQGWGRAEYRMGMLYENSNEFDKAISHYYNGEQLGDSAAMYRLGMMALLGQHGQRQDFQRGLDWINRAADTADEDAPQGAYVFGMLIARDLPDINVPEGMLPYKVDTARQYIEKAAYLGFAKAQLKMGQAYELCQLGCDFHPAYSLHYYGLASAQGQPEAALGVSRWFLFGYEGNFAKNEALAFKYAKQAADAKLPTGEFAMGYYHEIGIHVQKDLVEARRWYELAAAHGNTDAVGRLDSLSHDKSLSKQDHETTALTRIKSQHGSMRGKRPERLKRIKDQQHMAAVPEGPTTPNDPSGRSPRVSPHPSPRHGPAGSDGRPPAFGLNVNVDHGGLAMRPKSTAPYPEDDTRPLNVPRPHSAAPYPEEGPGYHPPMRAGLPGPGRPDAFGIRPGSAGRGGPGPNNLAPGVIPAGMPPPRGRVASAGAPGGPGGPPGGYRQGGPGQAGPGGYRQGSMGGQGGPPGPDGRRPVGGPAGNGPGAQGPQSPPLIPPAGSMPGTPGREYGGRSSAYPPPQQQQGPHPPRQSSQPQPQQQQRPGPGQYGVTLSDGGGRSSAPPLQNAVGARPTPPSSSHGPGTASPAPSVASAPTPAIATPAKASSAHPDGKTIGNGPATFDEMGIPKIKDKDDCVVM
ncbi:Chitin synthase regulatory factor 4 [Cytospora mali]|uniref:Chitin synthase regulatory factor 4 n=1 Tax=Cytospora mali TaxID=578113 RepID=A0A194V680_CYTMA|nr:Chitin synthase regulatory factor 4 [Valsa mali var. pyri (nom. inval.)]